MTATILILAFGPFAGRTVNGSSTLAKALDGRLLADCRLVSVILPVRWGEAERFVPELLTRYQPRLVLGLGEGRADYMHFEISAVNQAVGVDIAGQIAPACLEINGPAERRATLFYEPDWFAESAVRFALSADAGRYLCNNLLYTLLKLSKARCGFVHVPVQDEQADTNYLSRGLIENLLILLERNL